MAQKQQISLIMTVFNEGASVGRFFQALSRFTRLPDEVVIVDGGSGDNTVAIIKSSIRDAPVPVNLIEERQCNISRGRNIAIENAKYDLIAVTDMGCRIPEDWLERIVAPFEEDETVEVVGGYYGYHCETAIQHCYAHLCHKARLDKKTFLPSSRSVALKRHVWESVGGYPEHMVVGEDTYFDLRIRERGFNEVLAPEAKVYWEIDGTYRGMYRRYYRYARSAGAVGQQPKIYGFYITVYTLFAAWLLLALSVSPLFLVPFLLQFLAYSYVRVFRKKPVRANLSPANLCRYYAITLVLDAGTILGYLAGLSMYLRGKQEPWTPPPQA